MAALSIGKAWEDSVGFVRREGDILILVALLFMAVPGIIIQQMVPPELVTWMATEKKGGFPLVPLSFWVAMILALGITTFGSLSLFALALRPGISVGEALRLAAARLLVLIGMIAVVLGVVAVAALALAVPVGVVLLVSKPAGALLGMVAMLAVSGFSIYASIRLILLNPVVLDRTDGPVSLLRYGWKITNGHFWRLFAFLIVITFMTFIVSEAARIILGSIAGLIGGAEAAGAVGGVASTLVTTIVQIYMVVMLARIYRQLDVAG